MEINDALIDKLSLLARLRFTGQDRDDIKNDLKKMISFVDKLNELDTSGIEPLLHISSNVNILREDLVGGMCSVEEALLNAPVKDEQFFKVPKVINK